MITSGTLGRLARLFRERLREEDACCMEELVSIKALEVVESIGNPLPFTDFALQRGEERLVEAEFRGVRGQAFTSSPSSWEGTLAQAAELPLSCDRERAFFIAALNAVGRHFGWGDKTVHCRDSSPKLCGEKIGERLSEELKSAERVALVGYQPAILNGLISSLGAERVAVTDLNPENVGRSINGVIVLDGEKDLDRIASLSGIALVTGSVLTNGTIDIVLDAFSGKRVVFFGTTIAVPAVLLGFERLCFEAE